jgi:hypothetical protein
MDVLLPITSYPAVVSNVGLGRALSLSVRLGARVNALVQEMEIAPSSASGEALLGASALPAWNCRLKSLRCGPQMFIDCLRPITRYHDLTALADWSRLEEGDMQELTLDHVRRLPGDVRRATVLGTGRGGSAGDPDLYRRPGPGPRGKLEEVPPGASVHACGRRCGGCPPHGHYQPKRVRPGRPPST